MAIRVILRCSSDTLWWSCSKTKSYIAKSHNTLHQEKTTKQTNPSCSRVFRCHAIV